MRRSAVTSRRQARRMHRHTVVAVTVAVVLGGLALCAGCAQGQQTLNHEPDSAAGPLSVTVNIPAFRLDVLQNGRVTDSYTVAVGMRRYATPTGEFLISSLVWNPWWYPPAAPWAAKDSVTRPGPSNPMGKVKLALGTPYFMHGTPAVTSLGKAASHGCIRMHNDDVVQLASLIEQLHGSGPGADTLRPGSAWNWSRTRAVTLEAPVPVRIVYELAEVRDSLLLVYPDVYRRAGGDRSSHVMIALQRAGIDSTTVMRDAVHRLLRQSGAKPAQLHLRDLILPFSMRAESRRASSGG